MEHCEVHGKYYGTLEALVHEIMQSSKVKTYNIQICLLDIDVQGAEKVYAKYPHWNYIFIEPKSIEQLKSRLEHRGQNKPEDMKVRLSNA